MKLRTFFSLCVLIAFLNVLFFVCTASADKHEHDEITNAIRQKQSRWTVRDTSVSKLPAEERKKRLGSQVPAGSFKGTTLTVPVLPLPVKIDWRDYSGGNYVTPVKEQGMCGACWAFAATAALESKVLISQDSPGVPIDLSEQILTSCSGAGTCAAGAINVAADFISNSGLPPESCYPYAAADGACTSGCANWQDTAYKISGWQMVDPTVQAVKYALYNYGPLVTLMAAQTDFFYYSSGIYTYSWGGFEGYHSALIVGYDDVEQYFIVKSSWGADWGEAGYFRIDYSEMNSNTLFGLWTIAYRNGIAAGFPTIDGIPRNASSADAKDQSPDASANAGTGTDTGDMGQSTGSHEGIPGNSDPANGTNHGKQHDSMETPVLAGTVRDDSGQAVGSAGITAGKYTATTGSDGRYQFLSLPAGPYIVTAGKKGYASAVANVAVTPGTTVTKDFVISLSSSNQTTANTLDGIAGPGWLSVTGKMITPAAAETYYAAKRKERLSRPQTLPMASLAADINSEIQELARALRHDPKLIYDYVHNNIDYVPYYGSLKGAMLTYLDGSGNDFDQASLMIALLRASGYTAQYQYGTMTIPGDQLANWLGVDQVWQTIGSVLPAGGIPVTTLYYDGTANLSRVWVKATISGTDYLFDPAFKSYAYANKIDIGQAMGYSQSDLMTSAITGATVTSDYVRNLNETDLKRKLATYASNLVGAIRSGYPNQDMNQIISGRRIVPSNLTTYQTLLPFSPMVTATWDDVPAERTATLRIQHVGIDYTISVHDLTGKRLTLTYAAGAGNRPEILLDGITVAYGNGTTIGSRNSFTVTIDHPYADNGGTYCDQTVIYTPASGGTYAIVYNFGGISDALIQKRQQQLEVYIGQALPDASEAVRGETLNIMGQTWLKEVAMSSRMHSALSDTVLVTHHRMGLMAQEAGYYIDVKSGMVSNISKHNIGADSITNFKVSMLIASAFEHGILQQLMGTTGASTMSLFQIANAAGLKIFNVNSSNYATIRPELLQGGYSTIELLTDANNPDYSRSFQYRLDQGYTLILPQSAQLTSPGWQWIGEGYILKYFSGNSGSMGMIISGGYYGGYSGRGGVASPSGVSKATNAPVKSNLPSSKSQEPIDMADGAYLYDHTDLSLGRGAPLGLAFARSYSSNRSLSKRALGSGWTHNYDIYLRPSSHGEPVLGNRQPVDAAGFIAALYAGLDLLKSQDTIEAWMVASLASKWAVDQVIDNAVALQPGGGREIEFIKLADGTYSSPPGVTTQLSKNGSTYSLQGRFGTQMIFNTVNRIQSLVDVDGNTMTFAYSGDNLNTIQDAFGRTLTLTYSGEKISSVSDSTGRSVSYAYTGDDLMGYRDPENKLWRYGYDGSSHRMTTLTNPLGVTTATNTYDSLGRVMTQTVPRQDGTTATYNFYFSGYRNQEEDPDGHTITYYYDAKGREYAIENPLGYKVTKVFDGQDHTVGITDPRSYSTSYFYDGKHNLTQVANALNYSFNYTYDPQYRLTDTTDPLSHTTHFGYDSEHHLTGIQDALGNAISATYYGNGLGNTATDARSVTTTLTYDGYGNPQTAQTAGHSAVTYTYDAIGRMKGLTDQANATTGFIYDRRNLTLSKTDPLNGTSFFTYDDAGRLTTKTDRNNNAVTYTYTGSDKVDRITYPNSTYVQFNYNRLDNLTSMQDSAGTTGFAYDAANRLTSLTDPRNFTVTYQYDANGNVTRITYPGNKAVNYSYDELNRLKAVTNWLNQTATYNYDAAGRQTNFTNFNGTVTTYGYDDANRPALLDNKTSGGTVISNYQFTLDGNGNRIGIAQNEPLAPAQGTGNTSYTYNSARNRLLSSTDVGSFGYTNEGELNSGYGLFYIFDYEHRLTGIGSAYQFAYDGWGNRLQATRSGAITRYIYDGAGNLLAEADGNSNITRYYIYGQGLLAMVTPADQVYCYHYNATGSTIAVTDASQSVKNAYTYDPFGNITAQSEATGLSQPFKYVGQFGVMAEPNGFYYMRARYYDPQVGRFISEDPIGFDGGDVNLYAYVANNPVIFVDPEGLFNIVVNDPGGRNGPTYGGTITVTGNNGQSVTVSGSSWPNPTNSNPGIASGAYDAVYSPTGHQGRFPGVRLENGNAIPTLGPNASQNNQSFATGINIHSGYSSTCRGSAGCITIAPDQAKQAWDVLKSGETGTVKISRTNGQCGR